MVSAVFAKKASKKKIELHVDYVRSAPLGPAANRLEVDRAAQRCERVRRSSPSNAYKEKQVVEEFSEVWMILVTVRDRRRIENSNLLSLSCAPAVPRPRDSRTGRAKATTPAVVLSDQAIATSGLSFSVSAATSSVQLSETLRDSFNEAAIYSSTSDLGLDAERLPPTTCATPAVHDSAGKNSTLLLDVKHTRTQYDSLTTQGTYYRSRDRLSRK